MLNLLRRVQNGTTTHKDVEAILTVVGVTFFFGAVFGMVFSYIK